MPFNIQLFIRLLAGGWMAVFLAWSFGLPPSVALFFIYYTLLSFQTSIGATLIFVRDVIVWCSVGLLTGILSSLVIDYSLGHLGREAISIWVLLGILVLFGAYTMPKGPEARLGFITALLVAVVGTLSNEPWKEAVLRGSILFFALLLGIVVSVLLFPRRSSDIAMQQLIALIEDSEVLFLTVMRYTLKMEDVTMLHFSESTLLVRIFSLRQRLMDSQKCVREAKQDARHVDEFIQLLIYQQGRILNYLVLLIRNAERSKENALIQKFSQEFFGMALHVQHALHYWVTQLQQKPVLIVLNPLGIIFKKIEQQLKKEDLNQLHMQQLTSFFALYHGLQAFGEDMERILMDTQEHLPSPTATDDLLLPF